MPAFERVILRVHVMQRDQHRGYDRPREVTADSRRLAENPRARDRLAADEAARAEENDRHEEKHREEKSRRVSRDRAATSTVRYRRRESSAVLGIPGFRRAPAQSVRSLNAARSAISRRGAPGESGLGAGQRRRDAPGSVDHRRRLFRTLRGFVLSRTLAHLLPPSDSGHLESASPPSRSARSFSTSSCARRLKSNLRFSPVSAF